MIASFADRDTERLFDRQPVRRFLATLRNVMLRKLLLLDAAVPLNELRMPPEIRLEKLNGDRTVAPIHPGELLMAEFLEPLAFG